VGLGVSKAPAPPGGPDLTPHPSLYILFGLGRDDRAPAAAVVRVPAVVVAPVVPIIVVVVGCGGAALAGRHVGRPGGMGREWGWRAVGDDGPTLRATPRRRSRGRSTTRARPREPPVRGQSPPFAMATPAARRRRRLALGAAAALAGGYAAYRWYAGDR